MEWQAVFFLVTGLVLILMVTGARIFIALGWVGIVSAYLLLNPSSIQYLLAYDVWKVGRNFLFAAIPLFILMSSILENSRISSDIYDKAGPAFSHFPGGLLLSNIGVCAILGATTGSLITGTIAVGTVAIPQLKKRNYDMALTAGSLAAGGTLGVLIPPSITMIIYGGMVGESVGRLFLAGLLPGIMMAVMYGAYISVRAIMNPKLAPKEVAEPWGKSLRRLVGLWPVLILVAVVLGSIYGGVATPTEAAALGCAIAFVLSVAYRRFNWKMFRASLEGTVKSTAMVMMIIMASMLMTVPLANAGVFAKLLDWVGALNMPPWGILITIYLLIIFLGMAIEALPVILILLPVMYPLITGLGFDGIWFGVVIVLLNSAGVISPPAGLNIFVVHGMLKDQPFSVTLSGCTQFFLVMVAGLLIITVFPQIALALPDLLMGKAA